MKLRDFVMPWHVACPSVNTLSALYIKLKFLNCYLRIPHAVHQECNLMGTMTIDEMYMYICKKGLTNNNTDKYVYLLCVGCNAKLVTQFKRYLDEPWSTLLFAKCCIYVSRAGPIYRTAAIQTTS